MILTSIPKQTSLRAAITAHYRADETVCMLPLLEQATFSTTQAQSIAQTAKALVLKVRESRQQKSGIDAFMNKYDLSTQEGIVLMCLAEALLRIPDTETKNQFISDKLALANW